jgi:hypothetical protein
MHAYPDSRHRLLGALLGALTGRERLNRSKDIRLEADRFEDVIALLGQEEGLFVSNSVPDQKAQQLRDLFVMCFEDFDGRDDERRTALAREALEIFGTHAGKLTPGQLLETVER